MNMKKLTLISAVIFSATFSVAQAQTTIVDDNFAVDGTTSTDADYFGTSGASALEINTASIGIRSGSSGRQIHALFPTQTLSSIGDTLTGTITFVTPATINQATPSDPAGGEEIRAGFFDTLGNDIALAANLTTGTNSPTPILADLPGFSTEFDVELASAASGADLQIRLHNINFDPNDPADTAGLEADDIEDLTTTGRLLGTNNGFPSIGTSPDLGYVFLPNSSYTATFVLERIAGDNGDELSVTVGLTSTTFSDTVNQATLTEVIAQPDTTFSFGMFGMGVSSNAFGSVNTANTPDNGIDITSFTVTVDSSGGTGEDDNTCYIIPSQTGGSATVCL